MSANIVDLLLGGAGGGIIGTIGSFAMKWQENKTILAKTKLDNDHQIELSKREEAMLQLNINNAQKIQGMQMEMTLEQGADAAFLASQEADKATYATVDSTKASAWLIAVDVVRGFMRPGLTMFLASLNGYMTIYLMAQMVETQQLAESIAMSSATLAGMAISWWFGARTHAAGN